MTSQRLKGSARVSARAPIGLARTARQPAKAIAAIRPTAARAGTPPTRPIAPATAEAPVAPTRSAAALVDNRFAKRDRDGMSPGVSLELGQDVPDVALHRFLADEEAARDVSV